MLFDTCFDRFPSLSARELSKMHSATVEILEEVGMWFESSRAIDIFKKHGFRTDGQRVYFTERSLEKALEAAPAEFTVLARDPRYNMVVGGEHFAFAGSGGSPFFMEYGGVQRPATLDDHKDFLKLTQALDAIDFNRGVVSPRVDSPLDTLYPTIKLTSKPYNVSNAAGVKMVALAFGVSEERIKQDAERGLFYAISGINPLSPLGMTAQQSDRLIELGEYAIPQIVASMPVAGTSAPCTLPGLLILQNAEQLGVLVFMHLINPLTPIIYGCIGTSADMRTGGAPVGAPEARVIEAAACQLARFYGLPTRGDGGLTDALSSDFQAGAEAALHFYNAVRTGLNLIPGAGELGSWNHGSLEKFVLDAEIIGYLKRIFRPLEFSDENMAVDVIKRVGPRGSYITDEHTLKHYRSEFHRPVVFSRAVYEKWVAEGRRSAADRAHARVKAILESYEPPALDRSIENDLDRFYQMHR